MREPGGLSLQDEAMKIHRAAEDRFRQICRDHLREEREKMIAAEVKEDFDAALELIEGYDRDLITPEVREELDRRSGRYEREIRAERDCRHLMGMAEGLVSVGKIGQALEMLETYLGNPRYAGTVAVRRMGSVLEELRSRKKESQGEEGGFTILFDGTDDSSWDFGERRDRWSVEGGVLAGRNDSPEPLVAVARGDDWKDCSLQLRFRAVRGTFVVGCRGRSVPGSDEWEFSWTELPPGGYADDRWYEIYGEIRGERVTLTRSDTHKTRAHLDLPGPEGRLALAVMPGGEIHFKAIRVKHLGEKGE